MSNINLNSVASLTQKLKLVAPGLTVTSPSRLGDIAEHWVALLAAWKGAEVYPNLNCTGPTDFIMVVNGVPYQLDVKLARPNTQGYWRGNTERVQDPVIPVLVIPTGDITNWKVQWIRNRYPQELENFWNRTAIPFTHETKASKAPSRRRLFLVQECERRRRRA